MDKAEMSDASVTDASAADENAREPERAGTAPPEIAPADIPPADPAPAETAGEAVAADTGAAGSGDEPDEILPAEAAADPEQSDPAEIEAPATEPVPEDDGVEGRLERIIESVLFATAAPIGLKRLVDILAGPSTKEVLAAVRRLSAEYAPGRRGIQICEVAGGYQLRTARENAEWVRATFRDKPARLGRATLETLAVVAYKQPVTRADIEAIRGVDVDSVLSGLLARRLIKIAGRKEAVGRPLLYATTPEFLETFGLKDLNELPSLKELGPAPDADEEVPQSETEATSASVAEVAAEAEPGGAAAAEPAIAAGPPADAATPTSDTAGDGAPAEDSEPGGDCLTAESRGTDSGGSCAPERASGEGAGNQSEPADRPDHD